MTVKLDLQVKCNLLQNEIRLTWVKEACFQFPKSAPRNNANFHSPLCPYTDLQSGEKKKCNSHKAIE